MSTTAASPSGLINFTRRRSTVIAIIWMAVSVPFFLLYSTSRRVVLNEIRNHAMGVAIAAASGFDYSLLDKVRSPSDVDTAPFAKLQFVLTKLRNSSPDVHFIYTMRRSTEAFAPVSSYQYVVDSAPRDYNKNGVIDRDEQSELPGTPYDAAKLPAMIKAWDEPSADYDITKDPPYPDVISGYAPIRTDEGKTVAIIGVDVLAKTVSDKLLAIRIVITLVWLAICVLTSLAIRLHFQQGDAFSHITRLNQELESRNALLREANETMAKHGERFERELKLAQTVQMGFLPTSFPRQDRLTFDKFYLTCATLGGDLFDVFDVDQDHVGLYMADVAGRGVSAALISGLLRMAVSSVRDRGAGPGGVIHADLTRPDAVVRALNELLVKEMPENEYITLIYAVIDMAENKLLLANAGHPWPVRYVAKGRTHVVCKGTSGMALGLEANQKYPLLSVDVSEGDKVVFYTDGLTQAMNAQGEEFGDEKFFDLMDAHGNSAPNEIVAATRAAIESHRGMHMVSDDFSMLVAEIR